MGEDVKTSEFIDNTEMKPFEDRKCPLGLECEDCKWWMELVVKDVKDDKGEILSKVKSCPLRWMVQALGTNKMVIGEGFSFCIKLLKHMDEVLVASNIKLDKLVHKMSKKSNIIAP